MGYPNRGTIGPTPDLFMVEVYRSADAEAVEGYGGREPGDGSLLGTIDIPSDELTLYLVRARDANAAGSLLRGWGASVLRVTAVDVRVGGLIDQAVSGNHPMLRRPGGHTVSSNAGSHGQRRDGI